MLKNKWFWLTIGIITISLFLLNIPNAEGEREKANVAIDMPIFYDQPQEQTQPKQEPRTPQASISLSEIQEYAKSKVDEEQWDCLYKLVLIESGWNPNAQNKTSTAYGLFQFLDSTWAGTGYEKTNNPYIQLDSGLVYITARYGSPCTALSFQLSHNWY